MKVLLLNGSPRQGNTMVALQALKRGLEKHSDWEVQEIVAENQKIVPCKACNACMSMSRCIFDDDSPAINQAVEEADAIVFATPVYWWGVTAQLKLIIDKFYARSSKFKMPKKVGSIAIGEAELDDPEYDIIATQFRCICEHLEWEHVFAKSYMAGKPADLKQSEETLQEIEGLAELLG